MSGARRETDRAIELAVRTSYGRLIAILSARTGDVAAAEDALGDALAIALQQWPDRGLPANPDAWLVAVARRRLTDASRRRRVRTEHADAVAHELTSLASLASEDGALPDRRADLLFACAHPAIDRTLHTPLMLQAVLGLDAAIVAGAFLTAPAAMAQRLVRAKRKLRDAGARFAIPEPHERPARLGAVLEAIYAAYGAGWDHVHGGDPRQAQLALEAIWLGRVIVAALPGEPEAIGLLALMLYCESRRDARRDLEGRYVALGEQDTSRWSYGMIAEAEQLLTRAAGCGAPGRFQIEAAIQSAHLAPRFGRPADWEAIVTLYNALATHISSVGAQVSRAAAIAQARGAPAGLAAAEAIDSASVATYQPWWALRAHLLATLQRAGGAISAYDRAIGLTQDPAVRDFLVRERSRLAVPQ